jgi:hypothetical protein
MKGALTCAVYICQRNHKDRYFNAILRFAAALRAATLSHHAYANAAALRDRISYPNAIAKSQFFHPHR